MSPVTIPTLRPCLGNHPPMLLRGLTGLTGLTGLKGLLELCSRSLMRTAGGRRRSRKVTRGNVPSSESSERNQQQSRPNALRGFGVCRTCVYRYQELGMTLI
jgi:hypothetical protein